jgi:hypothetical protein
MTTITYATARQLWNNEDLYHRYDLASELNDLLEEGFEPDDAADVVWNSHDGDRLHYDEELTFSLDGEDIVVYDVHRERFTAE